MDIEIIPTYIGIIIAKQDLETKKPGFLSFKKGQYLYLLGLDKSLSTGYATSNLDDPFGTNSISGYVQYNMFNTVKGDFSLKEYYNSINIMDDTSEDTSDDTSDETSEEDTVSTI